jgi:hypothetical protein
MRHALPLLLALASWFALCAYMTHDAFSPTIPCTTDSECMRLNGGDGSPNTSPE